MSKRYRRRSRRENAEESLVNLTPLIDVVFVVLIMFIVIAPMLELDQITLAPGLQHSNEVSRTSENETISIQVHENDSVWLEKQPVRLEDLKTLLIDLHQRRPTSHVKLFQDRRATFGTYQEIKNAVEIAGYTSLDVVLKPT